MIKEIAIEQQLVIKYILLILITQYVFLINWKKKKQRNLYHVFAILVLCGVCKATDEFVAEILMVIFAGLNICISRKEHKLRGVFLVVPIMGLMQGLTLPIALMPGKMIGFSVREQYIYQIIIYSVLIILYLLFIFVGKKWRAQFALESAGRCLELWEELLLGVVGILLLFFSSIMDSPIKEIAIGAENIFRLHEIVLLLSLSSFGMTIAVIIVVIVSNKQKYYFSQVSNMQFNIIVMMAEIVENRDKNTGGHIKRTAKYVEIIAKQLKRQGRFKEQLTDEYIKNMMVAAPLHDIGKIHISDVILNKKDRLTEEEFEIMKNHTVAGRDLLSQAKKYLGNFSYLDIAEEMAGAHHEWWNGKGYPDKLQGEEIPLSARIMAVADMFDALTSRRCYKEPMSMEEAYSIIQDESGTHFDKRIVSAFCNASASVKEALENFNVDEEMTMDSDMAYFNDMVKK